MTSHDTESITRPRALERSAVVLLLDAYAHSPHARMRAAALSASMQAPLVTSGTVLPGRPARLVVMGDRPDAAVTALTLVEQRAVPVLIARTPVPGGSIVASSDLRRSEHPVLRESVVFGRLLGKRVTFVHNVGELAEGSVVGPHPVHESHTYLTLIAMHSRSDATAVVTSENDTVDAIVRVATVDDADLVIVGHGPRAGDGDWNRSVASAIIARCRASVLVLPVPSRDSGG